MQPIGCSPLTRVKLQGESNVLLNRRLMTKMFEDQMMTRDDDDEMMMMMPRRDTRRSVVDAVLMIQRVMTKMREARSATSSWCLLETEP